MRAVPDEVIPPSKPFSLWSTGSTREEYPMFRLFTFSARALVCGLFVLLPLVSVSAQFRAGVQGTVADATGAVVPAATVTLKNKETGAQQTTQTSEEGFYRISGLPP